MLKVWTFAYICDLNKGMDNKKTNWNYLYSQITMWYEDELVGEDVEETIEKNGYVSTDPYYQNEKSKQ